MLKITTHTIVKNEENWIWYALMAVKNIVSEVLVIDDASNDKTLEKIRSIDDPKIKVKSVSINNPTEYTKIRNWMISQTKTDWFLILDGDEVWNEKTLKKLLEFLESCPESVYGVVMRNRNCVGDVYHYQKENAGKYKFLGMEGNLTIRAYRKLPGFSWQGDYPLEAYCDKNGTPINHQNDHLRFFDNYYWHMTFLSRSSVKNSRKHVQIRKFDLGIRAETKDLPEVFKEKFLFKRSPFYVLISLILSPIRAFKNL